MGRPRRATTFGSELDHRGVNFDQAAVLAGVNPTTVRRIIKGTVRAQPKTVVSFSRAFGIAAGRMQEMMDAHWYAAHPDEDLRGAGRYVA